MVQSVDYFTPVVDDPYQFGQIAAANALSDIYAMGAQPTTVMNIVGFPIAKLPHAVLAEILRGGAEKVREAGAVIVGGHSIDDADPKFGMSVTGLCHPDKVWSNAGAQPGDALVLTKPIGVGIVTTAIKRDLATAAEIAEAVQIMAALNKTAAETARAFDVHACTDITGFGLLGHVFEMAQASGLALQIYAGAVPVLDSARRLLAEGAIPAGTMRNAEYLEGKVSFDASISADFGTLLVDAVTSGGLLLAVPDGQAQALVAALHHHGVVAAAVVGKAITGRQEGAAVTVIA